ncbi:MAG: hypothetical protein ACR2KS_04610 [Candidatus Eremiobacter antarcticus]|nr:hypothetical protein [Candidatus Eremiobacteraeota bacterium]MBC5807671.1 hypothetical protein [Candidatus Eremiobacteraeota bacterium]
MNRYFVAILALVVFAVCYQLLFRYQYFHLAGGTVMRVDRLSGASCNLPCVTNPTPSPAPTNALAYLIDSPDDLDSEKVRAVDLVREKGDRQYLVGIKNEKPTNEWKADWARGEIRMATPNPKSAFKKIEAMLDQDNYLKALKHTSKHTYLVCYCNTKGAGWQWEAHLDTRELFFVGDNADLSLKYGLTKSAP